MAKKYEATVTTPEGVRLKCLEVRVEREGKEPVIAQFGGLHLKRQPTAILNDQPPMPGASHTELEQRLLANRGEVCGSSQKVEVHHIRKRADIKGKSGRKLPAWKKYEVLLCGQSPIIRELALRNPYAKSSYSSRFKSNYSGTGFSLRCQISLKSYGPVSRRRA
jgi:hypothetical protein